MKKLIDIEKLKEIYLVSNTASFLYSSFIRDESILQLRKVGSQKELIEQFATLSKSEIDTLDDLVYAYALFVAILTYDNEETFNFLNSSGNISFEWFPELKNLYLSRLKSFSLNSIAVTKSCVKSQRLESRSNVEVNNQTIEIS